MASLEVHLDSIKAAYILNADKLDYNYRVLGGFTRIQVENAAAWVE